MPATPSPASAQRPDRVAVHAALIAVRQAAQMLCDRATLLVMLHAHAGACRYAEFSEQTGLASRLLSARLAQLTGDGLLVKIPYSRRPLRHAYHLTHMGVAVFDVLAALVTWEQSWPGPQGINAVVQVEHLGCPDRETAVNGMAVRMHCAACRAPVTAREMSLRVNQTEMAKMPAKATNTRRTSQEPAGRSSDRTGVLPQGLSVLGDKWSIEVLVCAHFGVRQFGEFGNRIGISTNILTDRLNRLVEGGLLRRSTEDGPLPKGWYLLTRKGLDFYPVMITMQRWADQWIDHRIRSPVKISHGACRKLLEPLMVCATCGQPISHANGRLRLKSLAGTGPAMQA